MSYLDDLFGVSGKTALVTGGATGIGRMIAEALAQGGARVLIASRKGEDCARVAEEINASGPAGSVEGFGGDVGSEEGCAALADEVAKRVDKLDILFNNAGVTWGEPLDTFPYRAWSKVMDVNVAGLFELTRRLLPLLEKAASDADPARVINLGSVMATGRWATAPIPIPPPRPPCTSSRGSWRRSSPGAASPSTPSRRGPSSRR